MMKWIALLLWVAAEGLGLAEARPHPQGEGTPKPPWPPGMVAKEIKGKIRSPKDGKPSGKRMAKASAVDENMIQMDITYEFVGPAHVKLGIYAYKPANVPLAFDYAPTALGPWNLGELPGWGPYPEPLWVGFDWTVPKDAPVFIRARVPNYNPAKTKAVLAVPSGVVVRRASRVKPILR